VGQQIKHARNDQHPAANHKITEEDGGDRWAFFHEIALASFGAPTPDAGEYMASNTGTESEWWVFGPGDCKDALGQARDEADDHANLKREIVRTERIVNDTATKGAQETAELMAHKRDSAEHGLPPKPKRFTD
jgi:hypothetical protein